MTDGQPGYRPDIDGLRAVAVMSVVGFHAFPAWLKGGFVGVDVFFVISGFLISGIILKGLEHGSFSYADFYARRVRRIFPALALVLAATLAFGWFALLSDEYAMLGKHAAAGAGFVSNFAFWLETGYFDIEAEKKPLLHLWSLGVEEQFYIVWPLLLALLWRRRRTMPAMLLGLLALSMALNVGLVASRPADAFYLPFTRFWELLLGALLALAAQRGGRLFGHSVPAQAARPPAGSRRLPSEALAWAGAILIAAALATVNPQRPFPGWWALLPALGTFCIIAAGPEAWINRRVLANRAVVGVGLISYPLYLWHWPLLSLARVVEQNTPSRTLRIGAVVASLLLAWLTYVIVEKPVRFGPRKRVKTLAVSVAMVLVGAAGWVIHANEGFGFRLAGFFAEQALSEEQFSAQMRNLGREPAVDDACEKLVAMPARKFYFCRYRNAGGSKTVALIGDSHAHVLYPGFSELMAARGWNTLLLGGNGCPIFAGTARGDTDTERAACAAGTAQILEFLAGRRDIADVVFSTRGPIYMTGYGFGRSGLDPARPILPAAVEWKGLPPSEIFARGAERTMTRLARDGKRVIYVLENPELAFHPAACIRRPVQFSPRSNCDLDLGVVMERQADYRRAMRAVPGMVTADPAPLLCPGGRCGFALDGRLMYADEHHLSADASRVVAQALLAPLLDAQAAGPTR